jgi:hypothetical protein
MAASSPSLSSLPIEQWGRRLSDAIRHALHAGDLAQARRLTLEGDGQSRSLAKEYSLMFKGLCATVGVLMDQLEDAAAGDGADLQAAASLVRGFREGFLKSMAGAWGPRCGDEGSPASLEGEIAATLRVLGEARARFDAEHSRVAAEVCGAIELREPALALELIARKEAQMYVPLHDSLVRFMADIFAWALRNLGEDGLLAFHMATAQALRPGFEKWEHMAPRDFAWATAFLLKQHMGAVTVTETPERFTFEQQLCGSGGRLRREGAYEQGPDPLPFVRASGPLTFGKACIPVYCSHCAVWNGVAPLRWFGRPHWVFEDPARANGSCTLHIFKNPQDTPAEYARCLDVPPARAER